MTNLYESLVQKLSSYSNERLIELLLAEKNNPGWTNSRGIYLTALKQVAKDKTITN